MIRVLTPALAAIALSTLPLRAASLHVEVSGIASNAGEIGCALFAEGEPFPGGNATTRTAWEKADPAGVTCRFEKLPAGRYAVAVSHDVNGNRKLDTNVFGIPREDWAVTNNIRPVMRAPRFDEAAIRVDGRTRTTVDIAR
ncbi:DUF2141 domain-containing protein [Chthonobacter albigriseus]|uniref:DUF2141 domain-containing protein n=1 Tax=Chthonobacter albigriseus TaxID=1683161 RepID=UPI0015EECAB0|nr:DUF2141 domain-containing protein [Chthonobacter albigriseus]